MASFMRAYSKPSIDVHLFIVIVGVALCLIKHLFSCVKATYICVVVLLGLSRLSKPFLHSLSCI